MSKRISNSKGIPSKNKCIQNRKARLDRLIRNKSAFIESAADARAVELLASQAAQAAQKAAQRDAERGFFSRTFKRFTGRRQ